MKSSARVRLFSRKSRLKIRQAAVSQIEVLESRQMMDTTGETVQTAFAPLLANTANASSDAITLSQHFTDSTLPGTLVTFETSEGNIQVGLTDAATPLTVANFLNYVDSGSYNGSFFHRSANLSNTASSYNTSASSPATIIQAGGYNVANGAINAIPTNAPVQDEYTTETLKDTKYTLAMAKTSLANSATDEFYFNSEDNTELDTPTTDSNGVTTSYTVFGTVLSGQSVIDTIASLPTYNVSLGSSDVSPVPVMGLTQTDINNGVSLTASNLVFIYSATSEPGTSYTATSDDPSLVTPTVSTNGVLNFSYASGLTGTADITVKATNLDGTTATATFPVTVPSASSTTTGPVANNFSSSAITTGVQGTIHTLNNVTDSTSSIPASGVTIVTQPANGTASVDSTTGYIDYTSKDGFTGTDTLTYTVTDTAGNVSSPATISVDVVPTAATATIGTGGVNALVFTQPDGTKGTLTVTNGSAVVTFANYQVSTSVSHGILYASGAGTTISDVTITNRAGLGVAVNVKSAGAVTLGSVNDAGIVVSINAPTATMTGTSNLGALNSLNIAAANDAVMVVGGHYVHPSFKIGSATNTSLTCDTIGSISSRQWLNTDGGAYSITANYIESLAITGSFAENLNMLSKTAYDLFSARVAQPSGYWNLSGSTYSVSVSNPTTAWTMNASNGFVQHLVAKGTLSGTLYAGAINSLTVAGNVSSAYILADAGYVKNVTRIGHIGISGALTNSEIVANGNVGSITAASMSGSKILAGVSSSVSGFPTSTSDLSANASIGAVVLGHAASSFSNSEISAYKLGTMSLGDINTSNGGTPEGLAGHIITSVSATLNNNRKTRLTLGPAQLKSAAVLSAYLSKKSITLADMEINLF